LSAATQRNLGAALGGLLLRDLADFPVGARYRQLLSVEAVLEDRRLAFGRPGLDPRGSLAQSAFVDEDDGAAFAPALFLVPARPVPTLVERSRITR
jgi:hypothetical protein